MMEMEPELEPDDERYIMYIESSALLLLFVAGLVANIPVLIVYFRSKHIRSITDKFILNLLVADFLSIVLLFPSILVNYIQYSGSGEYGLEVNNTQLSQEDLQPSSRANQFLNSVGKYGSGHNFHHNFTPSHPQNQLQSDMFYWNWSCGISNGILAGLATASVLAALEIAMERYLAVVKPLHYHKLLTTPSIFITSVIGGVISVATAVISTLEPNFSVFPHCAKRMIGGSNMDLAPISMSTRTHILMGPNGTLDHLNHHQSLNLNLHKDSSSNDHHHLEHNTNHYYGSVESISLNSGISNENLLWSLYSLGTVVTLFIIPVCLMIYIYIRIYMEARRQKLKMTRQYRPYFLPIPPGPENSGLKGKGTFLPILVRFKLMNRLRDTRKDRAARVAVVTLAVTLLCWFPYYFVRASNAIQTLMTVYRSQYQFPSSPSEESSLIDSQSSSKWSLWNSTVLPLLFACLHPLLSPIFYAYRYKRLRTEIRKTINESVSICTSHDKVNRVETRTSNRGFSAHSPSGGTPCIRQATITHSSTNHGTSGINNRPTDEDLLASNGVNIISNLNLADPIQYCAGRGMEVPSTFPTANYAPEIHQHSQICIGLYPDHIVPEDEDDQGYSGVSVGKISHESNSEDNGLGHYPPESTPSSTTNGKAGGIVIVERSFGNFFNYLNVWVNSYSRRWLQHRESVTSTASFITLLSTKYHNKAHPVANV